MSQIAVAGAPGALTEFLVERLRATLGDCRHGLEVGDGASATTESRCEAVVYPARADVDRWSYPDLLAAGEVLERVGQVGARHLVLVSSAAVHEPSAHHPGHVSEQRLAPPRLGNTVAEAWRALEELASDAAQRHQLVLTVLRPTSIALPRGRDYFSRLFAGRWAVCLPGFDPSLQLLSPEDLATAVGHAVERGEGGVYHLAPSGVMPLRKALRAARCRRLPVPHGVQWLARKILAPAGLAAPIDHLEYLRHGWTVSAAKIQRELGFEPRHSSAEAITLGFGEPGSRSAATPAPSQRTGRDFDPFGMDEEYVARLGKAFFPLLHDRYWRIEWRGLEHVPRAGRAVLAGVHRGHQPWDGVMTFYLLVRELGRYPRYLIHPTLVKFPFLAPYMIKCGGVHACQENADWVLEREGLLAIFPEGIRGAFTMYRDAYKLGKFGRDDYVKIALRHGAPIIPYVTVGSAEIFPILGKIRWRWWKRYSEWPFFPITPTMGTVPLPSKWHTWFLEPIPTDAYPPEAADDRAVVGAISRQVRASMEAAIGEMLHRRKSIFWGSIFGESNIHEEAA